MGWEKMANKNKTKMGVLSTAFGAIFLLIGVTLSFFELMALFTIPWPNKVPHLFNYTYQFVGIVLILTGAVFLVVGVYMWRTKSKKEH